MKEIENYPQLAFLFKRRSIRKFLPDAVPQAWVDMLLKAAMAAPSAMNNQPWEFVVITDPDLLEKIRQTLIFGRHKAPLAIAVCGNKLKARNKLSASEFWIQDCSAAVENLLLAATGLGLGGVWLGVHPVKLFVHAMSKLLKLPRHITPLAVIYLGYPLEQKDAHTKYNPKNVHWQQYGQAYMPISDEE
jgi:nitroreductase